MLFAILCQNLTYIRFFSFILTQSQRNIERVKLAFCDALAKIKSGASLIPLYTALVYQGPGLIKRLNRDLAELLREEGFESLEDAIGVDVSTESSNETKEKGTK